MENRFFNQICTIFQKIDLNLRWFFHLLTSFFVLFPQLHSNKLLLREEGEKPPCTYIPNGYYYCCAFRFNTHHCTLYRPEFFHSNFFSSYPNFAIHSMVWMYVKNLKKFWFFFQNFGGGGTIVPLLFPFTFLLF